MGDGEEEAEPHNAKAGCPSGVQLVLPPSAVNLMTQHHDCQSPLTCLPIRRATAEPHTVAGDADVALVAPKHQNNIHSLPGGESKRTAFQKPNSELWLTYEFGI